MVETKKWQSKIRRRFNVLRQLPDPNRRFQFFRIFVFMLTVPWLMRLRLPRLKAMLDGNREVRPGDFWDGAEVQSIINDVDRALQIGRPFVHRRCLSRGITLYYFLRRTRLNVGLCFGVSNMGDELLTGHCWLVRQGKPLGEPVDPRQMYTVVYSFPEARQ